MSPLGRTMCREAEYVAVFLGFLKNKPYTAPSSRALLHAASDTDNTTTPLSYGHMPLHLK